jgi:hypothetical protein
VIGPVSVPNFPLTPKKNGTFVRLIPLLELRYANSIIKINDFGQFPVNAVTGIILHRNGNLRNLNANFG